MCRTICLFLFLALNLSLKGQNVSVDQVLLRDVSLDRQLLNLSLSNTERDEYAILMWRFQDGRQAQHVLELSPGLNKIDMSLHPDWKGRVSLLATNNPNVTAFLSAISIRDRWVSFWEPKYVSARSINFCDPIPFFGFPFRYGLYCIAGMVALILILLRTNWKAAIYLGFLGTALLLCLRNTWDEQAILRKFEKEGTLVPFADIQEFVHHIKPMVEGKRWSKGDLSGVINTYVKYQLAEFEFIPPGQLKEKDLLITRTPENGRVLHRYKGFYLMEQ